MATLRTPTLTPREYLEIERNAEFRSDYISGEMFMRAGTPLSHTRIVVNLTTWLTNAFVRRPCESFSTDLRLKITETAYVYPDVMVVCYGPKATDDRFDTIENPTVIFEVLSKSTELHDRGEKFALYRRLPSLQQYVLVSQHVPRIEWFTRTANDQWLLQEAEGLDSDLTLDSLSVGIALSQIYARVEFGGEPPSASLPMGKEGQA